VLRIFIACALSSELGNSNPLRFGMIVLKMEAVTLERKILHLVIVEGADGCDIGSFGQLLEVFFGLIQGKDLLDAVVVVAHVVLVFKHTEGSVDLVFKL